MIRYLQDIQPIITSHGVGNKRVLLSNKESGCSLTQIAVTELKAGEVAVAHIHFDMQEAFYVLEGKVEVILDGEYTTCIKDTFVYVDRCTSHEVRAKTDSRIMTIGCVIEVSHNRLYPMLFKQNRKTFVGRTEDWTISAVPNSESEVENGIWARYNFAEVINKNSSAILGRQTTAKYNNQLPLLTKIIDVHEMQIYSNDEMAKRKYNKIASSEIWYVLESEPGAYLYAGFKQKITPDEYKERVANGTIIEILARHEVHRGDVFYLPVGCVYTIYGSIRLAGVQLLSDVTYRIFDYDCIGFDGNSHQLHTERAVQTIDYKVCLEYKTEHYEEQEAVNEPFFSIKLVETSQPFYRNMLKYDSFVILMNLEAQCKISIHSTKDEVIIPADASCLIPAAIADYDIIPIKGKAKVLEIFINNNKSN